jgi:hypothetical protein
MRHHVSDEENGAFDHAIAYAIVYRFLHLIQDREPYNEDLDNVLRWGEMNSVGTMTFDPAYIDDWGSAAAGRGILTSEEAYDAMVTFLEGYASRGCRPSFTHLIERLKSDKSGMASLWAKAQNLVAEDVDAGEPYRGTYMFETDAQGRCFRVERDPETGHLRSILS